MSARLVGEVADWLTTPAAEPLTPAERLVLVLIAERANTETREMWRHRGDAEKLSERLARCCGMTPKSLGDVLAKLASRGLEVRVPIGTDRRGRPVFAHKGVAMDFRLPELPASASLPEPQRSGQDRTFPVDNPVDNPAGETPGAAQRSGQNRSYSAKGPATTGPKGSKGPVRTGPHPSKSIPSKSIPSTPPVPVSVAEVEVPPRASPDEQPDEQEGFSPEEFRSAQGCLLGLPDLGAALIAQAAASSPGARREIHVIRAARAASKGAPA